MSYKYLGGGMLTTVTDLVKLGMALNCGTPLKPETLDLRYSYKGSPPSH